MRKAIHLAQPGDKVRSGCSGGCSGNQSHLQAKLKRAGGLMAEHKICCVYIVYILVHD